MDFYFIHLILFSHPFINFFMLFRCLKIKIKVKRVVRIANSRLEDTQSLILPKPIKKILVSKLVNLSITSKIQDVKLATIEPIIEEIETIFVLFRVAPNDKKLVRNANQHVKSANPE